MKAFILLVWLLPAMKSTARPDTSGIDRGLLMGYFEHQQYARAADYVSGTHDSSLRGISLLGYACYMSNQLSRAEACYRRIFTADSANAMACDYLGKISLVRGDRRQALHYFCLLVSLQPGVAEYDKQLADLWGHLGNENAAGYYYRLSYQANPRDPGVVAGLADYLTGQHLYREADSILDRSLQQDSLAAAVIKARIRSAYAQEDYKVIFPLAGRLKRMENVSLRPFLYAAIGYYYLGNYPACVRTCDFLITQHLKSRAVLYLEAMAFKKQKKYKLSLAMLDECVAEAIDRDADGYYSAKGDIYETMGEFHAALRQYDTAAYIFHSPVQLYRKARIYDARLKSPRTALRYYRLYLRQRRDTVPQAEKKVYSYARSREKKLAQWEREISK
jgi:tetratricopeptide (TPR) repeat protein